jgi:hypothetical protein
MRTAAVALALLIAAGPACAQALLGEVPTAPYQSSGNFVILPAKVISGPVYQIGFIAGAAVCLPASLIQNASTKEDVPHDKEASIICGRALGKGLGWPVYAAAGLPFFLIKGLFWDGPRALFGVKSKD